MPSAVTRILIGISGVIIAATWIYLVLTQPSSTDWTMLAESRSSTIALWGTVVAAILSLVAVLLRRPVQNFTYVLVALGLNIGLGHVISTSRLPLPLYLDSFGTVLVGAIVGPAIGMATGVLSALVWGTFNPAILPFAAVYAFIGIAAGLMGSWWRAGWWRIGIMGLVIGFVAALMSTPVASFIFGGKTGIGSETLVSLYQQLGFSTLNAVFLQSWTSDPIDKFVVFSVVWLAVSRWRAHKMVNRG